MIIKRNVYKANWFFCNGSVTDHKMNDKKYGYVL